MDCKWYKWPFKRPGIYLPPFTTTFRIWSVLLSRRLMNRSNGLDHSKVESFNRASNKLYQSCNFLRQALRNLGAIGQFSIITYGFRLALKLREQSGEKMARSFVQILIKCLPSFGQHFDHRQIYTNLGRNFFENVCL